MRATRAAPTLASSNEEVWAMWQSEVSVDFKAAVELIYRRLANLEGHTDFSPGLAKLVILEKEVLFS
ncbi:MAG: hypothetical protein NVS1B3_08580 [Candidatus Dormibacteraceae bacterium]